jgi:colanic acid/amylovoran biosynthesis glycosyltransferase
MTDPLKVAYYLPRFPKLSETFILREMGMLRNLGVDVQIFSLFSPKSSPTMHEQAQFLLPFTHYSPLFSFKILSAQLYFILKHPRRYFHALSHAIWQTLPEPKTFLMALILFPKSVYFARQLEEMNVVHVHAHFVWLNGISAQVASDLLGISSSLHAHAWDIFRRKTECVRRQIELSSLVVTISAYHKRYLLDLCRDGHQPDVRVVHYGIDPFEFTPTAVSNKNSEIELISVGRLVEKKGFRYLIDACAILAKQGLTFHCSIVGDGQRDSLLFQIEDLGLQDKVSLLGPKNITEILKLYQISDIFVLPCVIAKSGDRDGMPNVLLEAMAMQIPVITTPVTGNCELVQDGINGMIVPERDSVALASAIETLMLNPDLRNAIGTQGRQTILSGFDIHSTAAEMRDLFQEMNSLK